MPISSECLLWFGDKETFWTQKITQEKLTKLIKKITSSHIIFCAKIFGYAHYILLTRRINTFRSKSIDKFWSRGIKTFSTQKPNNNFCLSLFRFSQYTFYLQKELIPPNQIQPTRTKGILATSANFLTPLPKIYKLYQW